MMHYEIYNCRVINKYTGNSKFTFGMAGFLYLENLTSSRSYSPNGEGTLLTILPNPVSKNSKTPN